MEDFSIHILGCGSANPTQRHRPASQVLAMRGKLYMVDCGEGTQTRLVRQGLAMNRIHHLLSSVSLTRVSEESVLTPVTGSTSTLPLQGDSSLTETWSVSGD